ncbi:helix-turn-helix domain-containing protein [Azospirillum soli]|uniref:helix-turn-helix domain-containing protein n=1 Tax=Azospirillum soli TaxID=1304799 RepID=UPI001AE30A1D|nr:helix-turn-helix transcriptional regulator [Azospirillum soli]MBP2314218.1 transcriptional regulator with XRE-family HTH domain [Azospirillum soli]
MDSIANQFGAILRDLRTAQGLSQEELAFRAGMSVPYLSDLERGRSNPSLAMVVDLARALATHPSAMLAGLIIEGGEGGVDPPRRKRPKD